MKKEKVKPSLPKFREVKTLPPKAKSVPIFCAEFNNGKGCTKQNIYNTVMFGRNHTWEIVKFNGINFVIPKKKTAHAKK